MAIKHRLTPVLLYFQNNLTYSDLPDFLGIWILLATIPFVPSLFCCMMRRTHIQRLGLKICDNRWVTKLFKSLFTFSLLDALTSVDPSISDIKDLEKYGVLIFISDNNIEIGARIKIIKECGKFGKSNHGSPLDQWEPKEDVSLYIIRQPISDLSSLSEFLRDNGDNLYQRVKSKEMYFVLCFERNVWQRNQLRLLKYDFFNNAKTRMI